MCVYVCMYECMYVCMYIRRASGPGRVRSHIVFVVSLFRSFDGGREVYFPPPTPSPGPVASERCSPYLSLTSPLSPVDRCRASKTAPRGLQDGLGALLTICFWPKRPPRALQEAFKRPSAAIAQRSCNPMPCYIDFDLQNEPPRPQKSMKSIGKQRF